MKNKTRTFVISYLNTSHLVTFLLDNPVSQVRINTVSDLFEDPPLLGYGISRRKSDDTFSPYIAAKQALISFFRNFDFEKDFRIEVWNAFFKEFEKEKEQYEKEQMAAKNLLIEKRGRLLSILGLRP